MGFFFGNDFHGRRAGYKFLNLFHQITALDYPILEKPFEGALLFIQIPPF